MHSVYARIKYRKNILKKYSERQPRLVKIHFSKRNFSLKILQQIQPSLSLSWNGLQIQVSSIFYGEHQKPSRRRDLRVEILPILGGADGPDLSRKPWSTIEHDRQVFRGQENFKGTESRKTDTEKERERVRGTRGTINPFKLQRRPSISLQLFPWTGTSLSFASLPPTFPISNLELQFLNQLKFVCFTGGCDRLLKYQVVKCRMKIWLFNFIIIINVIYRNILYNEKPMWPMKGMTTNV